MVALLLIVAFDLSALVQYITRFTEESFAILISVIFIYEAFTKIAEIYHYTPVHQGIVREDPGFLCFCVPSDFVGDPLSDGASGWNSTITCKKIFDRGLLWEDAVSFGCRFGKVCWSVGQKSQFGVAFWEGFGGIKALGLVLEG